MPHAVLRSATSTLEDALDGYMVEPERRREALRELRANFTEPLLPMLEVEDTVRINIECDGTGDLGAVRPRNWILDHLPFFPLNFFPV